MSYVRVWVKNVCTWNGWKTSFYSNTTQVTRQAWWPAWVPAVWGRSTPGTSQPGSCLPASAPARAWWGSGRYRREPAAPPCPPADLSWFLQVEHVHIKWYLCLQWWYLLIVWVRLGSDAWSLDTTWRWHSRRMRGWPLRSRWGTRPSENIDIRCKHVSDACLSLSTTSSNLISDCYCKCWSPEDRTGASACRSPPGRRCPTGRGRLAPRHIPSERSSCQTCKQTSLRLYIIMWL